MTLEADGSGESAYYTGPRELNLRSGIPTMIDVAWSSTGLEVLREVDFPGGRLNRPGTFVVCFGATWCPITRRFMPKFVALREKLWPTLAIADITDTKSPLWDTFRIRITPSIIVFRDGEVHSRIDGRRFLGVTRSDLAGLERGFARS